MAAHQDKVIFMACIWEPTENMTYSTVDFLISNNFRIWDPAKLARHKIATPMIYGSWIWVVELARSNIIEIIRIVRDDVAIGIDRYSEILVAFYLYVTLAHEKLVYWWHLQKLDHILIGLLFLRFPINRDMMHNCKKIYFGFFAPKLIWWWQFLNPLIKFMQLKKVHHIFSQKKKWNWHLHACWFDWTHLYANKLCVCKC